MLKSSKNRMLSGLFWNVRCSRSNSPFVTCDCLIHNSVNDIPPCNAQSHKVKRSLRSCKKENKKQTNRKWNVHVIKEVVQICKTQCAKLACHDKPGSVWLVLEKWSIKTLNVTDKCVDDVLQFIDVARKLAFFHIFHCCLNRVQIRDVLSGKMDLVKQCDVGRHKRCQWLLENSSQQCYPPNNSIQRKYRFEVATPTAPPILPSCMFFLFLFPHRLRFKQLQTQKNENNQVSPLFLDWTKTLFSE